MKTPFKKLRSAIPRASLAKDRWRFMLLWSVMLLIFASIIARAFYLQIIDRHFLQEKADQMILRTDTIRAYRGKIVDRNGVPLAVSTPLMTLWMDPREYLEAEAERQETLQRLAADPDNRALKRRLGRNVFDLDELALAVGLNADELKQKIKDRPRSRYLIIKRHLPPATAQVILDRRFQSVYRQVEYQRFYPQAQPNAQLIGLTNSRDQGLEGLELLWNSRLAGKDGKMQVMRDRRGNRIKEVELIEPEIPGEDIALSIDSRLQYIMYRELASAGITNNARSATAVAIDVKTGEVLAMASWPSFNPNDSASGLSNKDAMRNRAAIDMFEPGSTVKPLTVSAALESGKYHTGSIIETTGSMRIGNSTIRDSRNLGNINLETLIVKSSNVASAKIAQSLPKETMPNFYRRFGFGARTDLRFPGESAGLIMPESRWGVTEIATMSYGYGLGTTAVQLAQAYAVLGAGGMIYP
ncbi:MAG: penicillin-binding protein 2, partial [Pseudomonadota bacterium]|nr:penicillin-binding protein 2 [Pseudomonadota bacterium]